MNLIPIFVCAYLGSVLSNLGGVGGGGILIPFYTMIGDIAIKEAIVLSILTIIGSSFVRLLFYGAKRHRNIKNRFLPDYNVIRLVVPFDGNMAYLGFLLNRILPNYVIIIGIILLLCILIYKTIRRAIEFWFKRSGQDHFFIIIDNIDVPLVVDDNELEERPGETYLDLFNYILYAALSFILITFLTIVRESSPNPWFIYAGQMIIIALHGYTTVQHISLIYKTRQIQQFNFVEGDIAWKWPSFLKYIFASSFTGLVSTLLGIGGGIIMNPIMINLGMAPETVISTSSITSFFSAAASSSQFLVSEKTIEWYHAAIVGVGALGSGTSLLILRLFQRRIKFIITVTLVVVLIVSMVMLIILGFRGFA